MRHLCFDVRSVQSSMRLEDPDVLVEAYTRKMMSFLLFNRTPHRILMIGLGGGSLVKFCHRHLPQTHLTVVEVDPDVIALRSWFCIPSDGNLLQVVRADGAEFVQQADWAADVLLVDAFDRDGVAPSLAATSFYVEAFRRLGPDGLLIMNLAGACERYRAHVERLREVCPGQVLLVPVGCDGNILVFAFAQSERAATLEQLEPTALQLQFEFHLNFPRFLRRLRAGQVL
jgi:spermidine synthase